MCCSIRQRLGMIYIFFKFFHLFLKDLELARLKVYMRFCYDIVLLDIHDKCLCLPWLNPTLAMVIKGGVDKRGGWIFGIFLLWKSKKCICNFVVEVVSKIIWSTSSIFFTVFIDILLDFVQLCLENFGKIITLANISLYTFWTMKSKQFRITKQMSTLWNHNK